MAPFWTPFRPRKKSPEPEDLPLSARVASVEGELLELRASIDRTYTAVKRIQGKVYRGVQLGETVDAVPAELAAPHPEEVDMHAAPTSSKRDLYRRAAQLRGA